MRHVLLHAATHLIVTLFYAAVAGSAPPKLSISVNRSAAVGTGITVNVDEPVTLEFSTDAGAKLAVFVVPKVNFDSTSDGRKVIFFAKRSVVFLVAAFSPTGEITKSEYLITVSGSPVPPPPGPGPTPPPPVPTPPTSTVGKAAYDAAMKVESPTRAEDAATLGKEFRAIHSKAVAVASMTHADILAIHVPFTKLAQDRRTPWAGWGPAMIGVFKTEITGTDAQKRSKAISAVEEIAKALEAVR